MPTATAARDYQRARVYTAETYVRRLLDNSHAMPTARIYGSNVVLPPERRWADISSLQSYVSRVSPGTRVRARQGAAKAHYEHDTDTIAVPVRRTGTGTPWALRQIVVLHEIAHKGNPNHGPEFCSAFLRLTLQEMGPEAHFLLRAMFYENGVDI